MSGWFSITPAKDTQACLSSNLENFWDLKSKIVEGKKKECVWASVYKSKHGIKDLKTDLDHF